MNIEDITISFDTAEEFLDYLQIRKSHWLEKGQWLSPWAFRGHGDASWELKPRIWRSKEVDPEPLQLLERFTTKYGSDLNVFFKQTFDDLYQQYGRDLGNISWDTYLDYARIPDERLPILLQILLYTAAEVDAITEFIEEVDRIGHPIPRKNEFGSWEAVMLRHVDRVHTSAGRISFKQGFFIWDGRNHPAIALAQHHGIPTSLLDWTFKPFVAALFAAETASKIREAELLAVWAIRTDTLNTGHVFHADRRLQKLTIPHSELAYLHAQDSLFIYDSGADMHFLHNGEWPSLDKVVLEEYAFFNEIPLRKITLPTSESRELIRLLWAEGINRAYIMPTYDNVTKALQTKWQQ